MSAERGSKIIRSYRLVFRRRWRIYRIQNWRVPLRGGLELRSVGYWLACLGVLTVLARLPLIGLAVSQIPPSLRLLALPIAGAWALSRWEVDGRAPHRAVVGIVGWWLRPSEIAGLRRVPRVGTTLVPLRQVSVAPDLYGSSYPRGRLSGPARVLLRYPVRVALEGVPRGERGSRQQRMASARRWRLSPTGGPALHRGKTLDIPAGRVVLFEPAAREAG
jgi:hypothetical protein